MLDAAGSSMQLTVNISKCDVFKIATVVMNNFTNWSLYLKIILCPLELWWFSYILPRCRGKPLQSASLKNQSQKQHAYSTHNQQVQQHLGLHGSGPGSRQALVSSRGRWQLSQALPECIGSSWPAARPSGREQHSQYVGRGDRHPQRDVLEMLLLLLVGPKRPGLASWSPRHGGI